MVYLFVVYFYFENIGYWYELERLYSRVIKAKSQRAAKHKNWSTPMTVKGERRCDRGADPRGKR